MTPPYLTVITPSLNQGAFIERTIASVLDQGRGDVELIVVDGGSTDGTVEVLKRYDDRIQWISEPDDGQTDALNKGLVRAQGDVIAYLNSDDYYLPGALDAVLPLFDDRRVRWVAGACRFLHSDGSVETIWRPTLPAGNRVDWVLAPWSVPQPSSFWRREVFAESGDFRTDLHYAFDTEFMLRLALAGVLPKLVDQELSVRFLHDAAKSSDRTPFDREARQISSEFVRSLEPRERLDYRLRRARSRLGRWFWVARGRPG